MSEKEEPDLSKVRLLSKVEYEKKKQDAIKKGTWRFHMPLGPDKRQNKNK